jgi:sulfur-carrier protein
MLHLQFFAVLKDVYGAEKSLPCEGTVTVAMLRKLLVREQAQSQALLDKCRFAVGNQFVSDDYVLEVGEKVLVMPPSSGG